MEPEVLERWGTNLRALGDLDEASRICELGLSRHPSRTSFQQCRLSLLGDRGRGASDIARAWDQLRLTTAAIPDSGADVTWWFRRTMVAAVLARSGLRDSAYAVLRASRAQRPTDDPNLLVQEAYVGALAFDTARVVALLGRYLERNPRGAEFLSRERRFQSLRGAPPLEALLRRYLPTPAPP
jgi:hypothetical protein